MSSSGREIIGVGQDEPVYSETSFDQAMQIKWNPIYRAKGPWAPQNMYEAYKPGYAQASDDTDNPYSYWIGYKN